MKKLIYLFLATFLSVFVYATVKKDVTPVKTIKTNAERMYDAITMYADSFNVPINIAFNVARIETGYLGPHHINYNHKQKSCAGALGPMQIMPQYASYFAGFPVSKTELRDSIELNVFISMKVLNQHFEKYKDWAKVLGAYNTGKPIINKYARTGTTTNYLDFWIPTPKQEETPLPEIIDDTTSTHIEIYKDLFKS